MKKVDFLLVYEHKARELVGLVLLKIELEKRGYSVEIVGCIEAANYNKTMYETDVILAPGAIDYPTFNYCFGKYVKFKKVINIPREQITGKRFIENKKQFLTIKDIGKFCLYCSWGDYYKKILVDRYSCNPQNVKCVGNIELDVCRSQFDDFFMSKKQMAQNYNLDEGKQWILFISSFAFVGWTDEEVIYSTRHVDDQYIEYYENIKESFKYIIQWFEHLLDEKNDIEFIYRPHPSEEKNIYLNSFKERYPNFHVITDKTVKDWGYVCDRIYTHVSTSIVELFYLGKQVEVLRPIAVDPNYDLLIYKDVKAIQNETAFLETIMDEHPYEFPISEETIEEHIVFDEVPTYLKIADLCEEMHKSTKWIIPQKEMKKFRKYQRRKERELPIRVQIKRKLINNRVLYGLYRSIKGTIKPGYYNYKKFINPEHLNGEEIKEIEMRIKNCLDKNSFKE